MAAKVKPHKGNNDVSNVTFVPLLEPESSLMFFLSEPAISTISFFNKGDVDLERSRKWLKERLTLICKANPWLTGRLVKKKKVHKNLLLAIPQPVTEEDIDALIQHDVDDDLCSISTDTSYEVICDKLLKSKMVVGPGYKLVGKEKPVSKFSLVKLAEGQVALIVSITHAVADGKNTMRFFVLLDNVTSGQCYNQPLPGYTYYKIMSMLSGDVQELSPTRKHDFVPKSMEAIGSKEFKYLSSFSFMLCCIKSMVCGSKAKLGAHFVDEQKVEELKADAKNGFVSTNDILTSTFSRATKSDMLLMAINLRKRVKEADEMDAGNYSMVVLHDAESSSSPSGIRQVLGDGPPFVRKGNKGLPGFFKTVNSKVAMITNWAFPDFKADIRLLNANGEKSTPLDLHLPIPYHPKEIAFPIAVIFKPRAGKLGILYGGSPRSVSSDSLIESGAPLGEPLSSEMFPIH